MSFHPLDLRFTSFWHPFTQIEEDGEKFFLTGLFLSVVNTSNEPVPEVEVLSERRPWSRPALYSCDLRMGKPDEDRAIPPYEILVSKTFKDLPPDGTQTKLMAATQMDEGDYYWAIPLSLVVTTKTGERITWAGYDHPMHAPTPTDSPFQPPIRAYNIRQPHLFNLCPP